MKDKNHINKTSLRKRLIVASIVPVAILGVVLLVVSYNHIKNIMTDQIKVGLSDVAISTAAALDYTHPGDYTCVGEDELTIMKGGDVLNDRFGYIDEVKAKTGLEISVFYDNIRFLTTIVDADGNRITGTFCNALVKSEVLQTGQSAFYTSVTIGLDDYYMYYMPLFNSDGAVAGMVSVGENAERAKRDSLSAILPFMFFGAGIIFIIIVVLSNYAARLSNDIRKLNRFMGEVSKGNLQTEMEPSIGRRGDEVSQMGQSATKMQFELRKLIEQDPLTGLDNRRSAARQLDKLMTGLSDHGEPFALVLCDIDHFKRVNDTYGHDAGDEVLKSVSSILKSTLKGKGFVARWGGEEFLLGFSGYTVSVAKNEMLQALYTIRETIVTVNGVDISVTMSFGVTEGVEGAAQNEMVKAADELLYYAKEHGRNRVVTAQIVEEEAEEMKYWDTEAIGDWEEEAKRLADELGEPTDEAVIEASVATANIEAIAEALGLENLDTDAADTENFDIKSQDDASAVSEEDS